jgi:GNAT superfamily N-acetyltransferase
MSEPPPKRSAPDLPAVELVRCTAPDLSWYREIFRRVGGPYLWFSRLEHTDEQLTAILNDPDIELYLARERGEEIGLMELDFTSGECELRFFGLIEGAIGKGVGRWLMNCAIERAWSRPIGRFRVRTCTLDHPDAVAFYVRSGFRPYKRQIEIADDPRLTGLLSRDTAPHVPIV